MLYTPLTLEEIYPNEDNPYQVISYLGKTILAEQREDQQLQLVQLISTDPQDYLHQSFTPGATLKGNYIHDE